MTLNEYSITICEFLFVNIGLPTAKSLRGKTHWLQVVNDCMDYALCYF